MPNNKTDNIQNRDIVQRSYIFDTTIWLLGKYLQTMKLLVFRVVYYSIALNKKRLETM